MTTDDSRDLLGRFRRDALIGSGVSSAYSPAYLRTMLYTAGAFLRWFAGQRGGPVCRIDGEAVRSYLAQLISTNARRKPTRRSPNTVYRVLMQLRAFCRWLVVRGVLLEDPTQGIRGPRQVDAFVEPIGDAELAALLRASGRGRSALLAARNRALVHVLAYTGIREAELIGLRRDALAGASWVEVLGKGGKRRRVGLHADVRSALGAYFALRTDGSPVAFVNQDGEPMTHAAVRASLKALGLRLGIARLGPHKLRRTAFTKMAEAGFSVFELRALGGWNTLVAADRYVRRGAERRALERQEGFCPVMASPERS